MKNYKIIVQYDGSRYKGWQVQKSTDMTIQGKLQDILTTMCGQDIEVIGSGRTDAGVHAYGQVANAHFDTKLATKEIMEYVNRYLPEDIAVISVEEVGERFHARLNASEKTYLYRVMCSDVPHIFDRRYVYVMPKALDIKAMEQAAKLLKGTHDFKGFSTKKKMKKSTVRTITDIQIKKVGDEIQFLYKGNGFLYHMVRILTGTLLEIGRGERSIDSIYDIFESKNRELAGELVPGKGLTLVEVKYENER